MMNSVMVNWEVELNRRLESSVQKRLKTAVNHAFSVERHVAHRLHARIVHELCVACIAHFFGWPLDPGKNNLLAALGFYRAFEVGNFAVWNVIAPVFNDACCAEFF